jgi:hypothetical protein
MDQREDMPTSWKRADANALRAHLQEALAERAATAIASDWSYSDYEVAAIRAELAERQIARVALRDAAAPGNPPDDAAAPCAGSQAAIDADLDRTRALIARRFTPLRRPDPSAKRMHPPAESDPGLGGRRRDGKTATHRITRLQRLL